MTELPDELVTVARLEGLVERLREALEERSVIGRAVGMLLERFHATEEQAFELLEVRAHERRRTVLDVAREINGEAHPTAPHDRAADGPDAAS